MLNLQGHKSNDMISLPLDIPNVEVVRVQQNHQGDYIITVESTLTGTRCQHCGRRLTTLFLRIQTVFLFWPFATLHKYQRYFRAGSLKSPGNFRYKRIV